MSTLLTLREAAATLGVHYMTAYRYVRLGLLPATKIGAEWKIERADLAEFRKPAQRPRHRGARWDARFERRLLAGDVLGAWSVIEAAVAGGIDLGEVHDRVVTPALRSIGRRWQQREISVAEEHQASAVATRVLGRLSMHMVRRGRSRGLVIVGTPAGERHSLPVQILADRLRLAGWNVIDLGCDLPAESFAATMRAAGKVTACVVSATTPGNEENTAATIAALRAIDPSVPIYAGGPAVPDEATAHALGAGAWAATVSDLIDALDRPAQAPGVSG